VKRTITTVVLTAATVFAMFTAMAIGAASSASVKPAIADSTFLSLGGGLNPFAELTLNGAKLEGDVSLTTTGGVDVSKDHIELFSLDWGSLWDTSQRQPRRQLLPVVFTKRIDRTTPLLYRALTEQATVAGEIKLFDTNPEDGSTRYRFRLTLEDARIVKVESSLPNTFDFGAFGLRETVEIAPRTITYTDVVNGVTFTETAR
jgi:type VI secretion system secreted protein Hcp